MNDYLLSTTYKLRRRRNKFKHRLDDMTLTAAISACLPTVYRYYETWGKSHEFCEKKGYTKTLKTQS